MSRVVVISGSTRPSSLNGRLAAGVARGLVAQGLTAVPLSLADYPLPFVDEDGRANPPETAVRLAAALTGADGLFLCCPEYNSGYPPLLKNALDWASMCHKGPLLARVLVALGAASPGARGGYRALTQLRSTLELGYGALVLPEMVSVPFADRSLTPEGEITDEAVARFLTQCLGRLREELARRAP